jgi:hypothetical protein
VNPVAGRRIAMINDGQVQVINAARPGWIFPFTGLPANA